MTKPRNALAQYALAFLTLLKYALLVLYTPSKGVSISRWEPPPPSKKGERWGPCHFRWKRGWPLKTRWSSKYANVMGISRGTPKIGALWASAPDPMALTNMPLSMSVTMCCW